MPTKEMEHERRVASGQVIGNYGEAIVSVSSVKDRWDVICTVVDPDTKEKYTETFSGIETEHVLKLENLIKDGPQHIVEPDVWDRMGETAAPRVLDAGKRISSRNSLDVGEAVDEILAILDRQAQEYLMMKDAEKEASNLADLIKANPEEKNNPSNIEKGRRLEGIFNMAQKSFLKDQQNIDSVIRQIGISYMPPSRSSEILLRLADEIDLRIQQLSRDVSPMLRPNVHQQIPVNSPEFSKESLPSSSLLSDDRVQAERNRLDLQQSSRKKELMLGMMGDFSVQLREMSSEILKGELKSSSLEDMSKRMREASDHFKRAGELQEEGVAHLKTAFSSTIQGVKQVVGSVLKHL